jgi:phospholipid/cholesterol/gamma-HCH transport system substrate-binding protein
MKREKIGTDIKVGIFVTLVLIVLAYMTFTIGEFRLFKPKGYKVYVVFPSVAGVDEKSRVKIAGVDAGTIERIEIAEGKARLTIRLNLGMVIRKDSKASIKGLGLLGEKYLELTPGSPDQPTLQEGDTITNVVQLADLDKLLTHLSLAAEDISGFMKSLNEVVGSEDAKKKMKDTISNIREITEGVNRIIETNDKRLNRILANLDEITMNINDLVKENRKSLNQTVSNIQEFSDSLKTKGPELVENLKKASDEIRSVIEENRTPFKESLENIRLAASKAETAIDSLDKVVKRMDRGEGTIGKLMTDEKLYKSLDSAAEYVARATTFKYFFDFRGEYMQRDENTKGYFGVTIQPTEDKFYVLQIVNDPRGKITTTETTVTTDSEIKTTKEEKVEDKLKFSAQIGRRYRDAAIRVGFFENTFGVGGDYYLFDDKGKISLEAWDFNAKEAGNERAHLKATASYTLFKYIFLNTGYDNFLNKNRRNYFFGGGVRFEDEDLKYLLGTMPIPKP